MGAMREAFDDGLRGLLEQIMEMGGLAEGMVRDAVAALADEDAGRLSSIAERERRVNALQVEVDEAAVALTVRQQPVARDVRMVFVAGRCAADVERVADQAVNVAGSVRRFVALPEFERATVPRVLGEMADAARRALGDALTALVTRDVELAREVLAREPAIDQQRDEAFRELLSVMITRPHQSAGALSLVLVSRNLERIGDHATNIAEEAIYLVRGTDVRHGNARP